MVSGFGAVWLGYHGGVWLALLQWVPWQDFSLEMEMVMRYGSKERRKRKNEMLFHE